MTIEEAREYWSKRLERTSEFSNEYLDEEERHAYADYIDALKHAVTALAICREREETEKKPKTVRRGRWILCKDQYNVDNDNGNYAYYCSCCKHQDVHAKSAKVSFCWNCGAKMGEGE